MRYHKFFLHQSHSGELHSCCYLVVKESDFEGPWTRCRNKSCGGEGRDPLQGNVEINTQIKYNSVDLSFMKAVKK